MALMTASDSATMVPTCRVVESAVRVNPARQMIRITFDPDGRPSGARRTRPVRPQAVKTVARRYGTNDRERQRDDGVHLPGG